MAFKLPQDYEAYYKEWEDKIGAFIEFFPDRAPCPPAASAGGTAAPAAALKSGAASKGPAAALRGLPFGIKDNIALEGFSFTCGSKLLEKLSAPYTAAAVEKLLAAGCVPIGKTNLDEFAMGATTDNSALKKTNNPWDIERVAGGSSGGSAAAVAAGLVPFALGSDTGGSIRQPAAFCGVVGLKPTYGAVSRYGLAAVASSLDVTGVLADSVSRCRDVFAVIRGRDSRDQTSVDAPEAAPPLYGTPPKSEGRVIGLVSPKAIPGIKLEDEVIKGFEAAKTNLAALGYTLKEVELPCLKYAAPVYHTIASAEASANMARFDSIRFGRRPSWAENPDDLMDKARVSGFGDEVKLRVLLGTYVLRSGLQEQYYLPARQIRDGIQRAFEALLGGSGYSGGNAAYDALLLPVFPARALRRGALLPIEQKASNLYTASVNLAGLPALSFPASLEGGLPVGVQLVGRAFAEGTLFNIAENYENAHPFPRPEGYRQFWEQE